MSALDGLMDPRSIGQGITSAFEAGQQKRVQTETHNALSAFAMDPTDPQAFQKIAQYQPEMAMQIRQQRDKAQQEAQARDLQGRAANGDPQALAELAGVDLNAWNTIDKSQQATLAHRTDAIGQAALFVSQQPPEQRPAAWDSMIGQLSQQYPDLAQMQGHYSDQALQGALASAGQVKAFLDTQKIDYKVIPQGARYVPFSSSTGLPLNNDIAPTGGGPQPGAVEGNHIYMGGDPADPASWQPVQGGPTPTASGNFRGLSGEHVTSGYRIPQHNREVRGVPNSYHTRKDGQGRALARDSVPPAGMSMSAYAAELKRLNPGMQVINEGDHVHIEPRG